MAKPHKDHIAPLAAHAGSLNQIQFHETIRHGKLEFRNGEVVEFSDPAAAAYFDIAFNGTTLTSNLTPDRILTDAEIDFDPDHPSGNETIDPHTRIIGRTGVRDGTTVHQVATGQADAGSGDTTLGVKDVHVKTRVEGA